MDLRYFLLLSVSYLTWQMIKITHEFNECELEWQERELISLIWKETAELNTISKPKAQKLEDTIWINGWRA